MFLSTTTTTITTSINYLSNNTAYQDYGLILVYYVPVLIMFLATLFTTILIIMNNNKKTKLTIENNNKQTKTIINSQYQTYVFNLYKEDFKNLIFTINNQFDILLKLKDCGDFDNINTTNRESRINSIYTPIENAYNATYNTYPYLFDKGLIELFYCYFSNSKAYSEGKNPDNLGYMNNFFELTKKLRENLFNYFMLQKPNLDDI